MMPRKLVSSFIKSIENYKEANFYKVISGFFAIGGDIVNNDGTSGEANSGMLFADENFNLNVSQFL